MISCYLGLHCRFEHSVCFAVEEFHSARKGGHEVGNLKAPNHGEYFRGNAAARLVSWTGSLASKVLRKQANLGFHAHPVILATILAPHH